MGNQVCSPFDMDEETLIPRLAYSYSIGDSMTLVLHPSGELLTSWGARGFKNYQDKEATLLFIKNLNANFKAGAFKYLVSGRMTKQPDVKIGKVKYRAGDSEIELPEIFVAAYEAECGKTAIIAVNPQRKEASFTLSGREYKIGALDAITLIV